jgi:DNA-binding response OmpR family regulator
MTNKKESRISGLSISNWLSAKTLKSGGSLQIDRVLSGSVTKHQNHKRSDLKSSVGSVVNSSFRKPIDHNQVELLLLRGEYERWDRIEQAINIRQWRYFSLTELSALQNLLPIDAKVFLVDAMYLPELSLLPRWLHAQKRATSTLYFISDHCDFETRVQAVQAGARKLFIEPIDFDLLMSEIDECIHPKSDHSYRVLVIADSEAKAKSTVDMLQSAEFVTKILTEPQLVIDTIWNYRPDAILMMDLRVTAVDYIVLTKLIREREESLAIPIIILSDDVDPGNELRSLQAGADDYLLLSAQSQQIVATVKCRIERAQAFSTGGVCKIEIPPEDLHDRKYMLLQLEQVLSGRRGGGGFHGLIVVSLESPQVYRLHHDSGESKQLVSTVAEGLMAILQSKDHLVSIGHGRLAILIQRVKKDDVEHFRALCFEIVKYKLSKRALSMNEFGINLQLLEDASISADEYLEQGELAADSAFQRSLTETGSYTKRYSQSDKWVRDGTRWLKDEFMRSVRTSAVSFKEHRFVSDQKSGPSAETIELIPKLGIHGGPVDLYQQAALCGAAAEFDYYVCEMAIRELYEYTLRGKWVRLILHQSAAVLEESNYIESIKRVLRRLHIVGNGLVLEFSLPSLASHLGYAADLFDELKALGMGVSLSHFPCNDSGYRALSFLRVNVIRPRTSLLNIDSDRIEQISNYVHSLNAEVVLPYNENSLKLTSAWIDCADCISAGFSGEFAGQTGLYKNVEIQRWKQC